MPIYAPNEGNLPVIGYFYNGLGFSDELKYFNFYTG